jgi:hypothetical protein
MDCPEGKIYNPKTKRCINDTPANRKKIGYKSLSPKNDLSFRNNLSFRNDLSFKRINSPQHDLIPPMGPLIHPDFIKNFEISTNKIKKNEQLKDNYIEFYTYLYEDRIPKLISKEAPLNLIELDDLLELSKIVTKEFQDMNLIDQDDIKEIKILENQLKEVFRNNEVIDNRPSKKNIGSFIIEPLRYKNRLQLVSLYNTIVEKKKKMEVVTKKSKNFNDLITDSLIVRLLLGKRYVDELIRLKIFSHDDLYKNMFENENVFEELEELHKKYMEAYKKSKKNSS